MKMTVSWLLRDRNIRLERNKKKNFFILFTLPYSRVGPIQCRSITRVTKLCIVYINKDINNLVASSHNVNFIAYSHLLRSSRPLLPHIVAGPLSRDKSVSSSSSRDAFWLSRETANPSTISTLSRRHRGLSTRLNVWRERERKYRILMYKIPLRPTDIGQDSTDLALYFLDINRMCMARYTNDLLD